MIEQSPFSSQPPATEVNVTSQAEVHVANVEATSATATINQVTVDANVTSPDITVNPTINNVDAQVATAVIDTATIGTVNVQADVQPTPVTIEVPQTQTPDVVVNVPEQAPPQVTVQALSAYDIWLQAGNTGTQQDFVESLRGQDGQDGAQGVKGDTGATGAKGDKGDTGAIDQAKLDEIDAAIASKITATDLLNADGTVKPNKVSRDALLDIALLPNILRGNMEQYYATSSIFNSHYQLQHNVNPFSGGTNVSSVTSADDSPLGRRYEIFTCQNATNSFTLHLASSTTAFNPTAGRNYRIFIMCRGVGASVGKTVTIGAYRFNVDRQETTVQLTESWSLAQTDEFTHAGSGMNLYLHTSGRGANLEVNEQMEVAAYYVLQT